MYKLKQNDRHFADDISNAFSGLKILILPTKLSRFFSISKGTTENIPQLIKIMAYSSKPMMAYVTEA